MTWTEFLQGDAKAFEIVYNEYIDDLYTFGVKFHSDKEVVLDCIHDLFVSLYNNPRIAQQVEVRFYLFSSLRRRLLKIKKEFSKFSDEDIQDNLVQIASPEFEWIEQESQEINTQRLKKYLEKLPKRQCEVLFLKYYMDFSYEEISSMMNVSVESCRTLSYRAIRQLKVNFSSLEVSTLLLICIREF
ncbi:RNA polymerase sigma factor [Sphingobacterium bovisgrunnientis]|uniref:RNA polymerase sigma factor n=1 Tax=Sphingobacterium bovisgrunnientis TaxID=1874697 RepID=UPI001358ABE7|nr:sigma-70 family RNA polymerase sigma factor [Sphingobacterium bovisgrunnientis]